MLLEDTKAQNEKESKTIITLAPGADGLRRIAGPSMEAVHFLARLAKDPGFATTSATGRKRRRDGDERMRTPPDVQASIGG